MSTKWIELITGPLEQKKQYRAAQARFAQLPLPYRAAADAINRYLMYYSGVVDGDTMVQMHVDLADFWERAAVDATPLHEVVGDDPVAFAEDYAQAYGGRQWIDKERERLVAAFRTADPERPES